MFLVLCGALGATCGLLASQVITIAHVYQSVVWLERHGGQVNSDFQERYGLFPWQRKGTLRAALEWTVASPFEVIATFSPPSQVQGILEQLESLPNIRRLNLSGSNVTSADLKQLTILSDLEDLILAATAIDDTAFDSITAFSQLRMLDVSKTHISDAALSQIASIKSLESVNLLNTNVSQRGLLELRRARPELVVCPQSLKKRPKLPTLSVTDSLRFFNEQAKPG